MVALFSRSRKHTRVAFGESESPIFASLKKLSLTNKKANKKKENSCGKFDIKNEEKNGIEKVGNCFRGNKN